MKKKLNCWEYLKCGREPGGINVDDLGVCPATKEIVANGLNSGNNAGRICWAITGTFCGGTIQGSFANKYYNCLHCEFFKQVRQEESRNFQVCVKQKNKLITNHDAVNNQFIFSETTQTSLAKNAEKISKNLDNKKIPEISIFKEITNLVCDEITEIDLNSCINYLKFKEERLYSHSINVAILSSFIGKTLNLGENVIKELSLGALLHDIGKMKISEYILNKSNNNSEELNFEENEILKQHTIFGYNLINNMGLPVKVAEVAYNHHERRDGKGYLKGLRENEIPLYAQIVSIANKFDYLTSKKKGISSHEAINIMMFEGQAAFNFGILYKFLSNIYKQDPDSLQKQFSSIVSN